MKRNEPNHIKWRRSFILLFWIDSPQDTTYLLLRISHHGHPTYCWRRWRATRSAWTRSDPSKDCHILSFSQNIRSLSHSQHNRSDGRESRRGSWVPGKLRLRHHALLVARLVLKGLEPVSAQLGSKPDNNVTLRQVRLVPRQPWPSPIKQAHAWLIFLIFWLNLKQLPIVPISQMTQFSFVHFLKMEMFIPSLIYSLFLYNLHKKGLPYIVKHSIIQKKNLLIQTSYLHSTAYFFNIFRI